MEPEQLTEAQLKWAIRKLQNKVVKVEAQPLQPGGKLPSTNGKSRRKNKQTGDREYSRPHPKGNRASRRSGLAKKDWRHDFNR